MNDAEVLAYVKAAAVALALPLDEAQAQRVAIHLGRTAVLAEQLSQTPLTHADEPAQVYGPAPFPALPATQEGP